MRIQTAVFVDDQNCWKFSCSIRRPHQVSLDASVALRRRNGRVLRLESLVILRYLLSEHIIGLQQIPDCRNRKTADGELTSSLYEISPSDLTVDIEIVQLDEFP